MINYDIIIIGGGPTGLAFAQNVASKDIKTLVLEKSELETIKNPAFDGKEIALTHSSVDILTKLEAWQHIPEEHISYIKTAEVFNGTSEQALVFDSDKENVKNLGYLIPNHLIRYGLYQTVSKNKSITIKTGCEVAEINDCNITKEVKLKNGKSYTASLVIAADSRFSSMRKQMGITAKMKDFSRTMFVCEMEHSVKHLQKANEYFYYDEIIATLPMPNNHSSIVITVKKDKADEINNMTDNEFNNYAKSILLNKLGDMKLVGKKHAYPLIGVYADSFVKQRFALIGDAAVGMHPVTAHGFNLGLRGSDILSNEIHLAKRRLQDIGSLNVLNNYQRKFLLISKVIYLGTNSIVALFTQTTPMMKFLREFSLNISIKIPFIKKLISAHLTESYRKQRNLFPFL